VVAIVVVVLGFLVFWAKREGPKYEAALKKAEEFHVGLKPYDVVLEGDMKEFYETCLQKQHFKGGVAELQAFCRCKTVNTKEYILPLLPNPERTMAERYKKIDINLTDLMALVMSVDKDCFNAVKTAPAVPTNESPAPATEPAAKPKAK
jgi:hypothetical protein